MREQVRGQVFDSAAIEEPVLLSVQETSGSVSLDPVCTIPFLPANDRRNRISSPAAIPHEDQRLIEPSVRSKQRFVKSQSDPVASAIEPGGAVKQTASKFFIFVPRIKPAADRTPADIEEPAVRAFRRLDGARDIPTILARLAQRIVSFGHLRVSGMSIEPQDITDRLAVLSGELEIGKTFRVAVDALQRALGVRPNSRVLDHVLAYSVCKP